MIFTLDEKGIFLFISTSFELLLGYEASSMQGRLFRDFIHPDDLALYRQYFNDVLCGKQPGQGLECRMSHAGGGWRWHTVSLAGVRHPDDAFICFVGVARDITERKEAEQALLSTFNRLDKELKQRTGELKALAREHTREAGRRSMLEAELEAVLTLQRETTARLQSLATEERRRVRREVYEDIRQTMEALGREMSWLAGKYGEGETGDRIRNLRQILQALEEQVAATDEHLEEHLPGEAQHHGPGAGPLPHESLSDNELRVLNYILAGTPIKQIAGKMSISPSTASTYRSRLLHKMRMTSDAEVIRYGIEHGLNA